MNPASSGSGTTGDVVDLSVIDALLDGEAVDKDALESALADAGAREYFVDALLLRRLAMDTGPAQFQAGAAPPRRSAATRWLAAAAIAVTTAVGGYTLGRGQQAPHVTEGAQTPESSAPAPAPTRTIRFEHGKNWMSNIEGN